MKQWHRHAAVMALLGIIGSPCAASAGNEGNGEVQLSPLEMAASKDTIDHITQVDLSQRPFSLSLAHDGVGDEDPSRARRGKALRFAELCNTQAIRSPLQLEVR